MEQLFKNALPSLAKELVYQVEPITGTDMYYTDGSALGSFLKLVVHAKKSVSNVFLFPSGYYFTSGVLPDEEKQILDSWIETVKGQHANIERAKEELTRS